MRRLRYLNPFRIRDAVRTIRRVFSDGGPKVIRLVEIGDPVGLMIPTATVTLEVEGRGGRKERFQPELPVPFPYAWAYRIARRLRVPLVRSLEPRRARFELAVPGRRG